MILNICWLEGKLLLVPRRRLCMIALGDRGRLRHSLPTTRSKIRPYCPTHVTLLATSGRNGFLDIQWNRAFSVSEWHPCKYNFAWALRWIRTDSMTEPGNEILSFNCHAAAVVKWSNFTCTSHACAVADCCWRPYCCLWRKRRACSRCNKVTPICAMHGDVRKLAVLRFRLKLH